MQNEQKYIGCSCEIEKAAAADGRYAAYARAMNALQQDAAEKAKAGKENPINE